MADPEALDRLFLLGVGRVGSALLGEVRAAGLALAGAWTRRPEAAAAASARTGYAVDHGPALPDLSGAGVVLLTVPDRAIVTVARRLVAEGRLTERHVLLHASGALPAAVMRTDSTRPGAVAGWHPLQSFSGGDAPLRGYAVGVEGEPDGVRAARALARRLGHPVMTLRAGGKPAYHAGAAMACNYLVTLASLAENLFERAGIAPEEARAGLGPLLHVTVDHLVAQGPADALTGPIARGDAEVVARHIAELERVAPHVVDLYRALGRHTLALAKSLPETRREELAALLDGQAVLPLS